MSNNGTLIIANEFHKAFIYVAFILEYQRNVDQMVVTWSVFKVYKIIKNGRFIPFHVPAQVSQPHKKEPRQVITHTM